MKCRTNRTGWKLDFSLPMENFATLDRNLRQTKYLTLTPKCYLTWTGAGSCSNDFPWEYRKQFLGWWRPGTAGEWLVGVGCCLARCSSSNTAHISSVTRKCGQLSRGLFDSRSKDERSEWCKGRRDYACSIVLVPQIVGNVFRARTSRKRNENRYVDTKRTCIFCMVELRLMRWVEIYSCCVFSSSNCWILLMRNDLFIRIWPDYS